MYAEQRYTPRSPKSVSLGAAVAINGLLIAGLVSMIPDIMPRPPVTTLTGTAIPLDPVPPPPKPKEEPLVKAKAEAPLPTVPKTLYPTDEQPLIESTEIVPDTQPGITKVVDPGPVTTVEPAKPVLVLIGAAQDPRFARDFQPEYPGSEIRAQRDGRVSLRVLIGTDGRVRAVEQLSATSPAFLEATRRQALAKWRFKPATRGGVPEESWKVMHVRFELKNL